jgi:pilus assembly protein CpaF
MQGDTIDSERQLRVTACCEHDGSWPVEATLTYQHHFKLSGGEWSIDQPRVVVGECRGPETMAMLWALATGHAGMTSVHGESAEHALTNLVRFALTSGARVDAAQALDWLREIDVVIHCDRPRSYTTGERRFLPRHIDEIVEVAGVEGRKLTLNPLFDGAGPKLRWLGTGPSFLGDLEQAGFEVPQ